jgi:hypothetical protein
MSPRRAIRSAGIAVFISAVKTLGEMLAGLWPNPVQHVRAKMLAHMPDDAVILPDL